MNLTGTETEVANGTSTSEESEGTSGMYMI
jgi:hypothetical protein